MANGFRQLLECALTGGDGEERIRHTVLTEGFVQWNALAASPLARACFEDLSGFVIEDQGQGIGERIELENLFVLETQTIDRVGNHLLSKRRFRQITVRASKALRDKLNR